MELSSPRAAHQSLKRKAAKNAGSNTLDELCRSLLEKCSCHDDPNMTLLECVPLDTVMKMLGDEYSSSSSSSGGGGAVLHPTMPWEMVAFGLLLLKASHLDTLTASGQLIPLLLRLLDHAEPRLRLLCVEVLSTMCSRLGFSAMRIEQQLGVYDQLGPRILQQIREKFVRASHSQTTTSGSEATIPVDDTTGWSSLESSMLAYYAIAKGGGARLVLHLLQDVDVSELLVSRAGLHQNRFVREATVNFIGECCRLISVSLGQDSSSRSTTMVPAAEVMSGEKMTKDWGISGRMAAVLKSGLQDNWSRIRQASCAAALSFLSGLNADEDRLVFLPTLLPSLCLNRFYAAEGVKTIAHDAWRQLVGTKVS